MNVAFCCFCYLFLVGTLASKSNEGKCDGCAVCIFATDDLDYSFNLSSRHLGLTPRTNIVIANALSSSPAIDLAFNRVYPATQSSSSEDMQPTKYSSLVSLGLKYLRVVKQLVNSVASRRDSGSQVRDGEVEWEMALWHAG